MKWNYRIARKRSEHIHNDKITVTYEYFPVEAYYDDNGKVGMISSDSASLYGLTIGELASSFLKLKKAFYMPILDYDKIPEPGYKESKESFITAMKNGKLLEKIEEDEDDFEYPTDEEIEQMNREDEAQRVSEEKMFHHLIREFVYHEPKGTVKLEDFFIK